MHLQNPFQTTKILHLHECGLQETKEDDYCYQHKFQFDNECHLLPSGRKIWSGCPKCREEEKIENSKKYQQEEYDFRKKGYEFNPLKRTWQKKEEDNPVNDDYRRSKGDY